MTKIQTMNKRIITALIVSILLFSIPLSVHAENKWENSALWAQAEGGSPIRQGGSNSLDNVPCESKEDSEDLEKYLKANDYILVTSSDMEITEEEYQYLCENKLTYVNDVRSDVDFYWENERVYVYKPLFDEAMKCRAEGTKIDKTTLMLLNTSTVSVDYNVWYREERIGSVVNEFNNNIPEQCLFVGFIEISSPIDAEIKLECCDDRTYNLIYVKANEPLLVRVKSAGHEVKEINGVEINSGVIVTAHFLEGKTLVQERTDFPIDHETDTEDNPKLVDITKAVTDKDIQPIDIDDKPDCAWHGEEAEETAVALEETQNSEIVSESAIVDTDAPQEEGTNIWCFILIGIVGVLVIAGGVIIGIRKTGKK